MDVAIVCGIPLLTLGSASLAFPSMFRLKVPRAELRVQANLPDTSWLPPSRRLGWAGDPAITGALAAGRSSMAAADLILTAANLPVEFIPPREDGTELNAWPLMPSPHADADSGGAGDASRGAADAHPNEMIDFGSRQAPRWLVQTILRAAKVTGVDPVYLMTLADVESSLSPEAKAPTSSAAGLFQFIDSTWLEMLSLHGAAHGFGSAAQAIQMVNEEPVVTDATARARLLSLRRDPYLSAVMAGELIKDLQSVLQEQGERELSEAELYLAHFLGPKAVLTFLKALDEEPNMIAAKLLPKAAKANQGLFTEARGRRKRRPITVAELYERIDSKIVKRLDRYDSLARQLPSLDPARAAAL